MLANIDEMLAIMDEMLANITSPYTIGVRLTLYVLYYSLQRLSRFNQKN